MTEPRRSGRTKIDQDHDSNKSEQLPRVKKRKSQSSAKNKKAAQKRPKTEHFDTQYLLSNAKSCLVEANLSSLINESTWELLSEDEKQTCLALLPDVDKAVRADGAHELTESFFISNVFLQEAFRTFQRGLLEGSFMPGYQKRLTQASTARAEGKADDYKEAQFELHWGDKQRH